MNAIQQTSPESERQPPRSPRQRRACRVVTGGASDRGRVRETNQDHFLITAPRQFSGLAPQSSDSFSSQDGPASSRAPISASKESQLLIVADGMGGHAGGERASSIAVRSIGSTLISALEWVHSAYDAGDAIEAHILAELQAAVEYAEVSIKQEAAAHPELAGMGTTLTMAYRHGAKMFIAHAGDSRLYLLRGGEMVQITEDHTLVGEMIRRGYIEANSDVGRFIQNVLTNALGGVNEGVRVETHRLQLRPGDTVLLCSDGLTAMLSDMEISAILGAYSDPQEAAERLIAVANELGGIDNITTVVARCEHRTA